MACHPLTLSYDTRQSRAHTHTQTHRPQIDGQIRSDTADSSMCGPIWYLEVLFVQNDKDARHCLRMSCLQCREIGDSRAASSAILLSDYHQVEPRCSLKACHFLSFVCQVRAGEPPHHECLFGKNALKCISYILLNVCPRSGSISCT